VNVVDKTSIAISSIFSYDDIDPLYLISFMLNSNQEAASLNLTDVCFVE